MIGGGGGGGALNDLSDARADYTNNSIYIGHENAGGVDNTAIGVGALSTGGGEYNTAVGSGALASVSAGWGNTAVGYKALELVTTMDGEFNTAIGENAGDNITSGNGNIMIGSGTDAPSATSNNQLNIGNTIYGDLASDVITIGTTAGQIRALPAAAQTISAGGTVTANACGTVKLITSGGAVTTSTTNTFTTPGTTNAGCCMDVVNTGANNITLDANTAFRTIGGTNQVVGQYDAVRVCSDGASWYQVSAVAGNQ
jgi:hypothetical protein